MILTLSLIIAVVLVLILRHPPQFLERLNHSDLSESFEYSKKQNDNR